MLLRWSFPVSLVVLALCAPAYAAPADLAVIAELPLIGSSNASTLAAVRLGRTDAMSLVSVTDVDVETWPVGRVSEPVVSAGGGLSPTFVDFDGDGLLDLAVTRNSVAQIVVFKGDGAGRFTEATVLSAQDQTLALTSGDVDGDGRPDLVLATSTLPFGNDPALLAFRSLGGLRFEAARSTSVLPVLANVGSVRAADLDGDGRADVVVSSFQGSVSIWKSNGDGTFVVTTQGLSGYYPGPANFVDLDGDGRLDLVYRNASPHSFWIEVDRNDGGARFSPWTRKGIGPYSGRVFVADVNGDGKLDLTLKQSDGGADVFISVFPGDGHGGFGAEERLALPRYSRLYEPGALDLVPLDWDGDGRTDFAVMTSRGPIVLGPSSATVGLLAVPVLLSTSGLLGSHFDSDLLLTNTGTTTVHVTLHYTAALGGGTGDVERDIEPGQQLHAASALDFLRQAGLPIAVGESLVGTLQVSVSGAVIPSALQASIRTTTPAGAGVSYRGVPNLDALRGDSVVPWLVESARDRTNLALVNAGGTADGPITLRVTVESGDPALPGEAVLPDVVLAPGGFFQFGRVLLASGLAARTGWARISRVQGGAPYLAWGVVNDAQSGDGSFVPAVDIAPRFGSIVPSVVQSPRYSTELIVTNPGEEPVTIVVTLGATGSVFEEALAPHQTLYLPDLFAELRRRGLGDAPSAGVSIASPLYVRPQSLSAVLVGARVSTAGAGGHFGLFEPGVAEEQRLSLVLPDLRQDERTRTNLGIVAGASEMTFRLEIHDGATGLLAASRDLHLAHGELLQINSVLRDFAPAVRRGWARVVPSTPTMFFAYAIVMDGAEPGQGTDDGSFLLGAPE